MAITILRLWPRVIEGRICCKWWLRVKMCCPETRDSRVDRSCIKYGMGLFVGWWYLVVFRGIMVLVPFTLEVVV